MTANEIIQTSEIKWIIERSKPQVDFGGNKIPGSAFFAGNLPARMAQAIKEMFRNAGAEIKDSPKSKSYSIASGETEKDFSISVVFGTTKSTQSVIKFNLSPYTW